MSAAEPPSTVHRARPPAIGALLSLRGELLAACSLVLLAIAVMTRLTLGNAYRDEVQATLLNSERSAQKLAVRVREVIDQADQTTLLVKSLYETSNPMNLAALREASLDASDVTRAVVRVDAGGKVIDKTSADVPQSVANAEEFKHHLRVRDGRLTLAQPEPDRSESGSWVIPAMRRLERPGGVFDGVVIAYVDAAALTRGFDAGEASGTALGVLGEDNVYRALLLDGKLSVGGVADSKALLDNTQRSRDTLEPIVSAGDGRSRFVTAVSVDRYPLYAVVAVSAENVVASYERTRRVVLSGAAAIATLTIAGTLVLLRQARRLDLSQRRAHRAESLYRATSEGSLDALFMLAAQRGPAGDIEDFVFSDANTRGQRLLRQPVAELTGMRLSQRLPQLCEAGFLQRCREVVATRRGFEIEFQVNRADVDGDWLHQQVVPLEDGIAIISRDVTERRAAQEQLDRMARLDPLTQLPNRRSFEEFLEQATARARRSGRPLTLVYLDLDGFKRVNDNFGHAAGDQLLVEVARRLKASVRITDQVSRLGGDEFTVVLEDSGDADDRLMQCERLLTSLSRPHVLSGQSIAATPSLGVAVYLPGEPLEELRSRADAAMYEAKRAGKACLRWAPPRVRETRRPE